jgi:hypothetical protein
MQRIQVMFNGCSHNVHSLSISLGQREVGLIVDYPTRLSIRMPPKVPLFSPAQIPSFAYSWEMPSSRDERTPEKLVYSSISQTADRQEQSWAL